MGELITLIIMANLNPNREKTNKVIDLEYNESVYIESYEDCEEFISEQSDYFMYIII